VWKGRSRDDPWGHIQEETRYEPNRAGEATQGQSCPPEGRKRFLVTNETEPARRRKDSRVLPRGENVFWVVSDDEQTRSE
jgi:hypothetical protein